MFFLKGHITVLKSMKAPNPITLKSQGMLQTVVIIISLLHIVAMLFTLA